MSYQAVDWVAEEVGGVNATDKAVLFALARKIPTEHQTVPERLYQDDIAKWAGCSPRSLRDSIKRLKTAGILRVEGRGGKTKDGKGIPCWYTIIDLPMFEESKSAKSAALRDVTRQNLPDQPGEICQQERGEICRQLPKDPNNSPKERDTSDTTLAFESWNAFATKHDLKRIQKITVQRQRTLKRRLDEAGGMDGWADVLAKVAASPFLLGKAPGRNGSPFSATFDWLVKEANFVKVMEGNYDERLGPPSSNNASGLADDQTTRGGRRVASGARWKAERILRERNDRS